MPSNDIEVFEQLTGSEDTTLEIDYFTYCIFAFKKKQWIEHFQKRNNGKLPAQTDIDGWIAELTDYDFFQMRSEAAEFFHRSAEEHLKEYIEEQKKDAVDESILSTVKSAMTEIKSDVKSSMVGIKSDVTSSMTEIKSFTSPWKHLGMALLMAVLAPVLLGGILFFIGIFDKSFPFHVTISPEVSQPSK